MSGHEDGSPLTKHVNVSSEESIVWLRGGPQDYPYLRETAVIAGTRARRSPLFDEAVAYAVLRPDAAGVSPGRFLRRMWSFQPGRDPYLSPTQGVKPHSIAAGLRSQLGRE
jgi:hypothetical protein